MAIMPINDPFTGWVDVKSNLRLVESSAGWTAEVRYGFRVHKAGPYPSLGEAATAARVIRNNLGSGK